MLPQLPAVPDVQQAPPNQGQIPQGPPVPLGVPPRAASSWFSLDPDGMPCQWVDFFLGCLLKIFCFCCPEAEDLPPIPPVPPPEPPLTHAQRLSKGLKEAFFSNDKARIAEILQEADAIEDLDLVQEPAESLVMSLGSQRFVRWSIMKEDESFRAIMEGPKHLKTLDLTGSRQITQESLVTSLRNNRELKVLILKDCVSLDQTAHAAIADATQGLEVLVLDGAGRVAMFDAWKEPLSKSSLELYMKNNPGLHTLSFPGSDELAFTLESPSFKALPLVYLDLTQPGSNSYQTFDECHENEKKAMEQLKAVLQAASQFPHLKELRSGHPHLKLREVLDVLQNEWIHFPKLEKVVCFGKVQTLYSTMGQSGELCLYLFQKNADGTIVTEPFSSS